jgi:hypothetical protein
MNQQHTPVSVPIEVIPLELSVSASTTDLNPWVPLFGTFEDNRYRYFEEVMAIIEAEREALGDEEIDPAFYQPPNLLTSIVGKF